jgi:hypothetical protein
MDRHHLEQYHANPDWRAAYDAALAEATATGMEAGHADTLHYATTRADVAVAQAEGAEAKASADLEATRARLAAREAEERHKAETAAAQPDPAQAALARAVAGINASRGGSPQEAQGTVGGAGQEAGQGASQGAEATGNAWASTVAKINARR